jgi:hypothetical protein
MSWRYSRWDAPSDMDYDAADVCEGAKRVRVTCVQCGRAYDDEADARPPYRCGVCCEANAAANGHPAARRRQGAA